MISQVGHGAGVGEPKPLPGTGLTTEQEGISSEMLSGAPGC